MGHARHHLDAFVELPRLPEDARRGAWRQAMASLAAQSADQIPVPLEGTNPQYLEESVHWALSEGLMDDLGWLSSAHAAGALYELAATLPVGTERREVGRRVLMRLTEGDAATFVALAQRLALGSRRGLSGPGVRSRVALALDLPVGFATGADGLALSLLTRPELERVWLTEPSTGSLPSRRLAARLLERAACEALRRSSDPLGSVVSVFERPGVLTTWTRLLLDREPLVWRHVASARGLLSKRIPMFEGEIARDLDPMLSPTEWRRAATSAAAAVAVDPEGALERCRGLLHGRVFHQDPGVASAMVLGLSRAADAEPEASEALLEDLVRAGGFDAIEALVRVRQEHVSPTLGTRAVDLARRRIASHDFDPSGDDGREALLRALDEELRPREERGTLRDLREELREAHAAFVTEGARAAFARALGVVKRADRLLDDLEATSDATAEQRRQAFVVLREIDRTLLETSVLSDLLAIGGKADTSFVPLDEQLERLTDWLCGVEVASTGEDGNAEHYTLHLHRFRAMLHLVDADDVVAADHPTGRRERKLRTTRWLLERVSHDGPSSLRRVVAASAARACDALLREEVGELSDILVLVTDHVHDPVAVTTMAEAAMDPSMVLCFHGYARYLAGCQRAPRMTSGSLAALDMLNEMIESMPVAGPPRVEALRGALVGYAASLGSLLSVRSLSQVAGDEGAGTSRIPPLAGTAGLLARLAAGARRRLGAWPGDEPPMSRAALQRIDTGVEHALRGDPTPLRDAVSTGLATLRDELPLHLADVADHALGRLLILPAEHPEDVVLESRRPRMQSAPVLPAWMPPSRVLGGFFVMRPLGIGAVGSVFVACRVEDRTQRHPLRFALKVPEYGGDVAHTLSQREFLELFREEAHALLAVPQHPNLARLVTFDGGARPKPILVMELVEGPTLQRLIDTRVLETDRVLAILDGVAAGLETMHAIGVGHLDVKPGNVILRASEEAVPLSTDLDLSRTQRVSRIPLAPDGEVMPVLVDFGLAGRKIRPGCATSGYGAPEVWGHVPEGHEPAPMAADVYAFACLAYETLTGEELFRGPNHLAVITSHLTHDGRPRGLGRFSGKLALLGLAGVLERGLRSDPRDRCTIGEMRRGLAGLDLARWPWPIV
jgi:chromatin segregation and condensation protein Rec8/ScpA/Scc1 (kleisin family)